MQNLDPKATQLFFLGNVVGFTVIAFAIGFGAVFVLMTVTESLSSEKITTILLIGVVIIILITILGIIAAYVWSKWQYRFYHYELREDGFRKEYGVITKRYVTIPYERIQNVDIYRGLLERILGLSALKVQTAGGSSINVGAEGSLPGLSHEVAEQLRDELVKRSREKKARGDSM